MTDLATHPSNDDLHAYSLGQLPDDQAVAIDDHISSCEPCCETIVSLSSDDTFVGQLQDARKSPTDQTVDLPSRQSKAASSSAQDVPEALAEHPRYGIVGLIGRCGMGDVYKATHRKMERTVALKVINRGLVRKTEAVDRFHREVKAAAQLSHPNIVTAFDADQADDFHFMVMEYVDGVDLSQTVKDRGALPVAEACDYICQAATGLQHAHEQGMVHRDIKPHNLMVTDGGTVKVLDFGLASLAPEAVSDADTVEARGDLTAAGAVMGTPDFISPEQAEDARSADIRSDIYCLGSTLYFLLSGRPPFHNGSVLTKLKSHATEEPVALESLRGDVPEELTSVVARMTAKNPDDRFQTPAEVAATLSQFVETGTPKPAKEPQTAKSKGFGKFLIGASLLGIAALLIVLNWQESVASKLAKMKAPVALTSEPPENRIHVLLYTVEAEALGGYPAAICDIGNCRIAVVNQDISRTRDFSEGINLVVSGPERTRQRAIDSSKGEYFTSIYSDSEAKCRFHNFNFTLTEKMLRFGTTGTFWDNSASPGMLIMVDADTGNVITQPMKPKSERVFLASKHRESPPTRLQPEAHASAKQPTTATESTSTPELRITTRTATKGTAGLPNVHDWDLRGRDVGDLKVRLLLVQNGKANVVQEFDFKELPAEFTGKVRLQFRDSATGADRKRRVNAILYVESPVPSRSTTINEDKGLSIDVEAPFSNRIERADLAPIDRGQTELLLACSYWKGDMNHGTSMESMTEATKDGKVTFLFVTLQWNSVEARRPIANTGQTQKEPVREFDAVRSAIRSYYVDKYPLFAALVNRKKAIPGTLEQRRQIGQLASTSPVSEIINSFPGKPYVTFVERTQGANGEVVQVSVDLYLNPDGTCRVEVTNTKRKKGATESAARSQPITEEKVRQLVDQAKSQAQRSALSAPRPAGPTTKAVRAMLKAGATRTEGNKLLKQLRESDSDSHYNLLTRNPDEAWSHVPYPIFYLRSKLVPHEVPREGSGWGRFKIEGVYELSEEPGWGYPLSLRPLLNDKAALSSLAAEVEEAVEQHPHWKAGVAVLSYLEAETGNYDRATELIGQVLADAATRPVPSDSAFVFGMALEGKNPELDRQVMRLYESSLRNRPARVFRASAIPKLARLHAKYDDHDTARQVLHRLEDVDYDPSGSTVYCSPAFRPESHNRCTDCHSGRSNLLDFVVMSNNLTDIGYPVDALISLARIDASFSNAYGSDEGWEKNVFPQDISLNIERGRSRFTPAKSKAENAITPQAVLDALKSGVFSGHEMTKPAAATSDSTIDLMLSVRGENGQATVFSPTIDVLKLVTQSEKIGAARDVVQIDVALMRLVETNPNDIETMVAATTFAFLRDDIDSAEKRLTKLSEVVAGREPF